MHTLDELINTQQPGWPIVQQWIKLAKNSVEVLPCDQKQAEKALLDIQVTTRSLMGAIVYETGGLLIDKGWIRILGSGSDLLTRSLPSWNRGKTFSDYGQPSPYLLIADDAIGGFYAINGGYLGSDAGNVYYFSPDSLRWDSLQMGYSQFLLFCFESDLNEFYAGLRWEGWQQDVDELHADYAYSFYPQLWPKQANDMKQGSKKILSIEEVYRFQMGKKDALQ